MAEIYLVRHGQASLDADDYDQLTELGYQQAYWLGDYFAERSINFDLAISGDLARQQQTLRAVLDGMNSEPECQTLSGLNEFDFQQLLHVFQQHQPEYSWQNLNQPSMVLRLLRHCMQSWTKGELDHLQLAERWPEFNQRVADALQRIREHKLERILVVTSGGVIASMLRAILQLGDQAQIDLNLQMKNTGITHCFYNPSAIYLSSFNHVPHLDRPERLAAIT